MAEELTGRFVVLVDNQPRTYHRWEDIPQVIEEVVVFEPSIPSPPHTSQQHAEIELWGERLLSLLRRHASRDQSR